MGWEAEEHNCQSNNENPCIPEEVKLKYFPQSVKKFAYDVLPLFEADEYKKKIMHEVSILENPDHAEKYRKFKEGWPQSARELKSVSMDSNKVAIFANYRRQKVFPEYFAAFVAPPSSDAIFRKTK